jgi:hypothetical protein
MKREDIVVQLDRHDFLAMQGHIDLAKALLAEYGLSLHVDHDMQRFVDYIGTQHDTHGVPNSHDPRKSYLHPDNSFWVYVREDASGDIIACHAQRLVVTDNFAYDCLAHTLFENLNPKIDAEPPHVEMFAKPLIAGKVMYGGGNYIRPDYRGKGLIIFNRASRTIALRHFRPDYFCGLQMNTPRRRGMALTGQAFAHVRPYIKGGLPGKPHADDVQISWSSYKEWMAVIRRELANQDAGKHTPMPTPVPLDPLREVTTVRSRG